MNINSGNIGELAGNQSILDKKERKHFKGIVFKRKYKGGDIVFSHLMHKLVSLPEKEWATSTSHMSDSTRTRLSLKIWGIWFRAITPLKIDSFPVRKWMNYAIVNYTSPLCYFYFFFLPILFFWLPNEFSFELSQAIVQLKLSVRLT